MSKYTNNSNKVEDSNDIAVYSDGIKIGWKILAIIASVGLALYVSSVVSPLQAAITSLEEKQKAIVETNKVLASNIVDEQKATAKALATLDTFRETAKLRADRCEIAVNSLQRRYKTLNGELQ